jgi:X-Pro dipeptidyl-peptidase-like protein
VRARRCCRRRSSFQQPVGEVHYCIAYLFFVPLCGSFPSKCALREWLNGRAVSACRLGRPFELVGSMLLKLWVSTPESEDVVLFVVLRKLDSTGREVFFSGFNGYERHSLARCWLRASHRELDSSRSTPLRPWHCHTRNESLRSGEIVPLEIEILAVCHPLRGGTHTAANHPGSRRSELPDV